MNNGFQSGLERRLEILKNRQREELNPVKYRSG